METEYFTQNGTAITLTQSGVEQIGQPLYNIGGSFLTLAFQFLPYVAVFGVVMYAIGKFSGGLKSVSKGPSFKTKISN